MTEPASVADARSARIRARLAELGHTLPEVAAPVAAYVPAVQTGAHVHTSGQLPFVDGALPATGKVGAEVTAEQAAELAAPCCLNALAAGGGPGGGPHRRGGGACHPTRGRLRGRGDRGDQRVLVAGQAQRGLVLPLGLLVGGEAPDHDGELGARGGRRRRGQAARRGAPSRGADAAGAPPTCLPAH